ncbi:MULTISPECIES: NHLP leader peptide family RiPP precursor [Nitrospirillum]|uniref:Putative ribosomally synthesized peptide n=1 Tax=Nitrospirillum amazonense TaxID=28077 RepID=A0A560G335_9PROT|nr:NHLP leader peptide family RiPP precursor [Nitrospirillum amazonense]MEC4593961.1 NHLP leader peptide family RiPP precursor [Nitrospirillum amazonense]TWB28303.1 putative ribosomally synthesized peptide [Nitrospirillum amazonense]
MLSANIFNQIIAKAWADDRFRARLLVDPTSVLKAEGVDFPAGVTVSVVENTATHLNLILPTPPTDLSDDQLDGIGGGFGWCFTL